MTTVEERWGRPPGRAGALEDLVPQIAALASRGLLDREIAERLAVRKTQVAWMRYKHGIPPGNPRGRPIQPMKAAEPVEPDPQEEPIFALVGAGANQHWCALLAAADGKTRHAMRRAVCSALKLPKDAADERMICAAQQDGRSADELANAYLLALGRQA